MKKRISTRVICLLVAVLVLAGALTVSAINGSPYENLKNAVINALFYENVTIELDAAVWIDGEKEAQICLITQQGDESSFTTDRIHSPLMYQVDEEFLPFVQEIFTSVRYETPELNISRWTVMPDGTQWWQANRSGGRFDLSLGYDMFGPDGRNSNYLRLIELAADLLVGDLKNNLTMSNHGDVRRITGAITESQLPEWVRILIDIVIDEQLRWGYNAYTSQRLEDYHVFEIPVRSLTIDRISLTADIDDDGNLLYINARGTITIENILGNTHEIEGEASFRFSEIGTTVPTSPILGADALLTEEFFTERTTRWGALFFTVCEAGNIDTGSITTQRPWRITQNEIIAGLDNLDLSGLDLDALLDNIPIDDMAFEHWPDIPAAELEAMIDELFILDSQINALMLQDYDGLTEEEIADIYEQIDILRLQADELFALMQGH